MFNKNNYYLGSKRKYCLTDFFYMQYLRGSKIWLWLSQWLTDPLCCFVFLSWVMRSASLGEKISLRSGPISWRRWSHASRVEIFTSLTACSAPLTHFLNGMSGTPWFFRLIYSILNSHVKWLVNKLSSDSSYRCLEKDAYSLTTLSCYWLTLATWFIVHIDNLVNVFFFFWSDIDMSSSLMSFGKRSNWCWTLLPSLLPSCLR